MSEREQTKVLSEDVVDRIDTTFRFEPIHEMAESHRTLAAQLAEREEEVQRLREQRDEAVDAMLQLRLDNARLRGALEPFTKPLIAYKHDLWERGSYDGMLHKVPVHWCFKAKDALAATPPEDAR